MGWVVCSVAQSFLCVGVKLLIFLEEQPHGVGILGLSRQSDRIVSGITAVLF